MRKSSCLVAGMILLLFSGAFGQTTRTELGVQGMGFFTSSLTANGTEYGATESAGVLGTYRRNLGPFISVEAGYGFSVNTQKYVISTSDFRVQTDVNQVTASFVFALPPSAHSRIKPYLVFGGGAMVFRPTGNEVNSVSNARIQTKGAFVYGAGLDYAIHPNLLLRAEYRGVVYGTPDFGFGALTTNSITQTAEPSIGVSYRF